MITYLKGDATNPQGTEPRIIAHVCNTVGAWGKGFVTAISKKWSSPETYYRQWYDIGILRGMMLQNPMKGSVVITTGNFGLGESQLVQVDDNLYVVNMIAQVGLRSEFNKIPLRYSSLEKSLDKLSYFAGMLKASVHLPRIGCGLAGGSWSKVEPLIEKTLSDCSVYVYDL